MSSFANRKKDDDIEEEDAPVRAPPDTRHKKDLDEEMEFDIKYGKAFLRNIVQSRKSAHTAMWK